MEQRLSFITLGVADLARAEAFYRALGWTPSSYGDGKGITFFQLPGMVFALFPASPFPTMSAARPRSTRPSPALWGLEAV